MTKAGPSKVLSGSSVTFNYVVTNDGSTTLFNVQLSDDKCSPISAISPTLAVGQSESASCTTTLTQDTTNTVTATGTDAAGTAVQATAVHTTHVFTNGLTVSKTCSPK